MSDAADAPGGDATVTFKVKTSSDGNHTITMAESATVLDLKTKLAGEDFENIPVERQRLIYSGRVMKNDDNLATYKIKANNTIHMVKSAASNPAQPAASAAQAAPQAPTNMASGTANNPLAGLTGARYAGQGLNMPGLDMFGPDGGMGPPMDEEALARMMADPNAQQALNEVLNNPDVVNHLIESNPMLRNVPNAREIIQSPFMRQMMTNPQMMSQMMRMRRSMAGGGGGAFPAPGATDNTPADGSAPAGDNANANAQSNPFMNPFMMMPGMGGGLGGGEGGQGGDGGLMNMLQQMQAMQGFNGQQRDQGAAATGDSTAGTAPPTGAGATTGTAGSGTPGQGDSQNQAAANPFAALFGAPGGGAGGAGAGANPFGMTPEMMQSMMQMMGGGGAGGAPAGPPDNRPPEERYEEQLRQLNDMGFFDFDRNVAALRRSGGSVQGAIEYLLNATD